MKIYFNLVEKDRKLVYIIVYYVTFLKSVETKNSFLTIQLDI